MNNRKALIEKIIPTLHFKFPYDVDDYAKNLYFENYHCHKDFSNTIIADSGDSIEQYANRCHELNAKCLFSGEHGSQGNQFYVYSVAEKENLKYRHSTEAYWVKNRFEKDRANCHMVIVAKNPEGRRDINYILSMANIDGYYYRPRIDLDLLLNVPKDNLIVTSACIAGWNYEDASDMWLKIHEHFQDNFFFELQANNTDPQKRLNEKILYLSDKYGIDIIGGLDSHYINDVGQVKRDQILKYKKVSYPEEIGWYMDYPNTETFLDRFKEQSILSEEQALRAIMNTNIFVDDCEEIVFDRKFKIPSVYKGKTYKEKCKIYKTQLNLAYAKEKNKSKEKVNGIRYEAKEIMDSGVVDYFLTSKKIVEDAVNNEGGILTTTSRGSAASYITNKLIGLTTVDRFNADIPIYPERFLTKERVDAGMMPDIDLNIAEQEPFVRATRKLLGEYGCMPLMAIEKLKKKAAWQLYAGANDVPPATANQISKYIDQYEDAVKYADDEDKELIDVEDYIPSEYIDLFRKSNDYQGITINLKVHACGHLIFDGDIRREIGLISAISKTTGKRTICACVEGGVLDDFGYVKEDFLIVDSVHLIYKCFHAIGKEVPSFEELREMIKDDKSTWDIYEKGITCCVNQCEKESTTNKVKKYKPKSLAELSAFIAAIRPGFASLLNKFLSREEYTTGESKIDDLLNDTAHFMLYQESIMKILSFLGMKMGNTYGVIKSISKKKLKGEKKEHLLDELKIDWDKEFHNLNNFMNVWNVIEDSSRYAFNSPHAYSMGGDSAYIAWFKAHYTSVFYETAINHYQCKGKKDKINALIKEAIKFFDYKMGDYEFGKDNRTVTLDVASKIIYPNLSSVKGFGEGVTNSLYEVGQDEYNSFIDVLTALLSVSISKTIIEKLIKINYFKKYGDINTLLKTLKYYDVIYGAKTISKDKAIKNNIPFELLAKYGHETKAQFNKLDSQKLLQELISMIPYNELTLKERLDNQNDILGIINIVEPGTNKRIYYVSDLEIKKTIVNISLYEIYSGKTRSVKMWTSQYNKSPFEKNSILYICDCEKKNKREPNGEINPVTGKKIYVPVPDKFEYWLSKYIIKNDIEEGE
jgi:DNA polymerase III alpha subunit